VPTESAISEDFEPYNDERELRRLIRAVQFSKKHYLYFACCNQAPKQNELIADVKKNLKGKPMKVVRFKKPITDLLTELQKEVIGENCEAVFVQGLEYSIASDGKGDENALIHNLNISRDAFKRYLSCPLFLWLPEYALVKITRYAPDFFSVRSGTFYFSNPPERVTERILRSVSSSWIEIWSLPRAKKLKQIEKLENLLAEYQGLHREKQDKQAEMRLLSNLAEFSFSISEFQKAIEYHKQHLAISREISYRQGESNSLGNLGNAYLKLNEHRKAIEYYEQSLAISREIGNRQGESASLGNLGQVYYALGKYGKAIEYHEQSLAISREIGNRGGEGTSLGDLGSAYGNLGDYRKAIEYHKQHLAVSREIGNRQGESASLGNLGQVYDTLGDYRKAIEYNEQSLRTSREIGNPQGEGKSLDNLGNIYYRLGEKDRACNLLKEALVIYEAIESPNANVLRQWVEKHCQN
jgi:tetratricopeptide (TPR) repeat protein